MSWCPRCRTEYEAGIERCSDCGALLVSTQPPEDADAPVVVFNAASVTEAQVVQATLKAEGIESYVEMPGSLVPNVEPFEDEPLEREVLVAPADVQTAVAVISQSPVSEADLAALAESSPAPSEE